MKKDKSSQKGTTYVLTVHTTPEMLSSQQSFINYKASTTTHPDQSFIVRYVVVS